MYVCVFCIEKNERQTAETNSIKTKTKRSVVVVPDWCQSHRTVVQATNVHRSQLVGTNMYIHAIKFVVVAAAQTKFIVINLCNHIYCVCCAVCVCVAGACGYWWLRRAYTLHTCSKFKEAPDAQWFLALMRPHPYHVFDDT